MWTLFVFPVVFVTMASTSGAGNVTEETLKRKRVANPTKWKRIVAKTKRNTGQEYVSRDTGKIVRARVIGQPCRDGCFVRIGDANIQKIHDEFWKIGDFSMQNAYMQKCIKLKEVKRRRVKVTPGSKPRRAYNRAYHFDVANVTYPVCFLGFKNILGVSEKRIRTAIRSVSETGTPQRDRRGTNRPRHAMAESRRLLVEKHIKSFPTVTSHYTRAKSPHMRYFEKNMSSKRMHRLYREWLDEYDESENAVKLSYYRTVLRGFRLGFRPPNTDTCAKCDRFKVLIEAADDEDKKARLMAELKAHEDFASEGQAAMAALMSDDDPDVRAICLDLEQTLPVPRLSTSIAYYKRKMWVYNLCIHNLKTNESKFYLWDEMNGGRGSSEIVSCLSRWLDEEFSHGEFSTLKVFSDNCGGQNKNINVILFYLREIHSQRLKTINHTYLLPGHSAMQCDRAFGNIEKNIRLIGNIYDFTGYSKAIKLAVHDKYTVIAMKKQHFLDADVLQPAIVHRKPLPPYSFQDARRFELRDTFPEGYFVGMTYDGPLGSVRLMRGRGAYKRKSFDLSEVQLPQKYPDFRRLQPGKLEHLKQLLDYIPRRSAQYLEFVIETQEELQEEEIGGGCDEDHLDYDDVDEEDVDDPDVDDPEPASD